MTEQATLREGNILIYTIHRVEPWFKYLGEQMGFERAVTFSDIRGDGDIDIVDSFYAAFAKAKNSRSQTSELIDSQAMEETIARCRVLRWLRPDKARAMVLAMAEVIDKVIDEVEPRAILSFPIDRYIMDILSRRAKARNIPYFEYTTAPFTKMSMLLHEGKLLRLDIAPSDALVEEKRAEIADPLFKPPYVAKPLQYSKAKWLKTFSYFRARGLFFQLVSWLKRDPNGLHYLDSQSFLGHKPRLSDITYDRLVDHDWEQKIASGTSGDRIAMPLALFPEASIDYWVRDLGLVDYENMLVDAATAFSAAGFKVLVKDHPLQFGFRQLELIERLKAIRNVIVLPYAVSGYTLLESVDVCFALTGTLGLQGAMLGKTAVVTDNYYTNDQDFVIYRDRQDISALPERVREFSPKGELRDIQARLVRELLKGCFDGDYDTFREFDPDNPSSEAQMLGRNIGNHVAALIEEGRASAR